MPEDSLRLKLNQLKNKGFFEDLVVLRGIEKESLRVDGSGVISTKDHPESLGSKYTNPEITIDFAESQIELVSPIFDSAKNMIAYLEELHAFVLNNLEEDESLWPLSMPPRVTDTSSIQIGKWPLTNNGKLKELYRVGLANRHGKIMQCVSGIHYNFSIDSKSLKILNPSPSNAYLGLIRNFKRIFWLVLTEFGASQVIDKSYPSNIEMSKLNSSDLYLKDATSLRMSNIGYVSSAQADLNLDYNSLEGFLEILKDALLRPYADYTQIDNNNQSNKRLQISDSIIQIENELYDSIRPKRSLEKNYRPYELLKNKGIEYVEVRGVDLDPNSPTGIDINKALLIELILLYCLINESPFIDSDEKKLIDLNESEAIFNGKNKDAAIHIENKSINMNDIKRNIFDDLELLAEYLKNEDYKKAIRSHRMAVAELQSDIINSSNLTFHEYGLELIDKHSSLKNKFSSKDLMPYKSRALESLEKLNNINYDEGINFDNFLIDFNSKLNN